MNTIFTLFLIREKRVRSRNKEYELSRLDMPETVGNVLSRPTTKLPQFMNRLTGSNTFRHTCLSGGTLCICI